MTNLLNPFCSSPGSMNSSQDTTVTEDDELMIRLQSGDQTAFDALVKLHQGSLIGFFYRQTGDRQLAEDLSQETLLRVYNQSWDYLPLGRFRGWMFRIGRNLMIDHIRKASHDALVHTYQPENGDEEQAMLRLACELLSPEQHAGQQELTALVDHLLQDIPEEQRLTFLLHHYAELPLPEVADVMETSVSTTKSRLRLAREKLQDRLARHGFEAPLRFDEDE